MSKRLTQSLKNRARAWAGQMTRLAKMYAPNHVKPAISSAVEEKGDGETFIIRTTADRKIAPDARAQEFGSGEHAQKGPRERYPIVPKGVNMLAFYENARGTWDYEMVSPPMPRQHAKDGRGLFFGVMHPGIRAANGGKGYLRPARAELRKRAKTELEKDVKDAILGDLRQSFGRKSR